MIARNELRPGNYITDDWAGKNPIFEVKRVLDRTAVYGPDYKSRFVSLKPILITAKILGLFGFIETTTIIGKGSPLEMPWVDYRLPQFALNIRQENDSSPLLGVGVEFSHDINDIEQRSYLREIMYVHELQNLYFWLTTRELTFLDKKHLTTKPSW